ncbi:MAG: hypothetical protein ACE15F_21970 [bacterium]
MLERLKSIREETGLMQGHEASWITTPDDEQQQILDRVEVQWQACSHVREMQNPP